MNACPLCGSDALDTLYPRNLSRDGGDASRLRCTSFRLALHPDILRCRSCTMVFNEPPAGHLEEYALVEDPAYLEEWPSRRLTWARELDRIEALCPRGDLLDVGCHAGFFLEQARERGWRVAGVEPSRWAADYAARQFGLEVFNGPIERFESERRFDVITLWDVFEHLTDPVGVLCHLRRLLRPHGLLAITAHKLDSPLARVLGRRYPFFMEMHTLHLTSHTRDLLLTKSNFTLVEHHIHRRALRIGYLLSRLERFGDRPARLARGVARRMGIEDRIVWIGFVGLETFLARPTGAEGS